MENELQVLEDILSTRLTDGTFRGIISFIKATIPGTPIGEIEKALVSSQIYRIHFFGILKHKAKK